MTGYYNFLNSKVTINGELNKIGEQIDSLTIELHQTKNILQSKEKDHLDLIKKFVALREENEALDNELLGLRKGAEISEYREKAEKYRKALEDIRDSLVYGYIVDKINEVLS